MEWVDDKPIEFPRGSNNFVVVASRAFIGPVSLQVKVGVHDTKGEQWRGCITWFSKGMMDRWLEAKTLDEAKLELEVANMDFISKIKFFFCKCNKGA